MIGLRKPLDFMWFSHVAPKKDVTTGAKMDAKYQLIREMRVIIVNMDYLWQLLVEDDRWTVISLEVWYIVA